MDGPAPAPCEAHGAGEEQSVLDGVLAALPKDVLSQKIQTLKEKRKALAKEKATMSKDLKRKTRQVARLKGKCARLSTNDLIEVLSMRNPRQQSDARNGSSEATPPTTPTSQSPGAASG